MNSITDPIAQAPVTDGLVVHQTHAARPRSVAGVFARALRVDLALALTAPAIYGAVFGWWQSGQFSWLTFAFLVVGVMTSALGYQALSTVYDLRRSQATGLPPTADLPDTSFALLASGMLPPALLISPGWLFLTIGAMSILWLALLAGWPILFFGGLSFLLMLASFLPPVRYADRGWGLGELGIGISFGVLPLFAGYYVQTQSLSWLPLAGGLPLMLLVFLVVVNGNLGAWHRDWRMGKRTLPVVLGPARTLDLSVALTLGAYVIMLLTTILSRLPLWNLAGMATLPLAMGAFSDVRRSDVTAEDGYSLRDTAAKAAIWTCVLLCAALLISRAG